MQVLISWQANMITTICFTCWCELTVTFQDPFSLGNCIHVSLWHCGGSNWRIWLLWMDSWCNLNHLWLDNSSRNSAWLDEFWMRRHWLAGCCRSLRGLWSTAWFGGLLTGCRLGWLLLIQYRSCPFTVTGSKLHKYTNKLFKANWLDFVKVDQETCSTNTILCN